MIRLPSTDRQRSFGFNMTPLIDVVFLLIIFFLVSSHLAQTETQLTLPLPTATTGDPQDEQIPRIVINVTQEGQVSLAGRTLSPEALSRILQDAATEKGDELQLRIRAAAQVDYARISPIVRAAAGAGIWDVHFAVIPRSPTQ